MPNRDYNSAAATDATAAAASAAADRGMRSPGPPGATTDISWTVAYPLTVRWMLKFYGDTRVVKTHYAPLKRYTDGLLARLNLSLSRRDAVKMSVCPADCCRLAPSHDRFERVHHVTSGEAVTCVLRA